MLGDLIYEANGKVVGYRVLDAEGHKIEVYHYEKRNFEGRNRNYRYSDILGGAYYNEGNGLLMIKDDVNELATWTGQGIAHYSGSKGRDVGSVFCHAGSTTGLLAFLNNMVGVFEYEVDENGNSGGKIWEWK